MQTVESRIKKGGIIQIPRELLLLIGVLDGNQVQLRHEGRKIVIEPVVKETRKRLYLNSGIVDKLVEEEEYFEPEQW